jgi:hypothetical protein
MSNMKLLMEDWRKFLNESLETRVMKISRGQLRNLILEIMSRQKSARILYHIGPRPPRPVPKMTYLQDWDPDVLGRDELMGAYVNVPGTDNWQRYWLDSPVKSGVFLTPNPLDIAANHGRAGHVYAYRVPQWVIAKSGGLHRYDRGSEVLIPEDVWEDAGKKIEFLGKSMEEEELWEKINSTPIHGPGHRRPAKKPSWLSDEEMRQWEADQDRFSLTGLRATNHPEDVIKLLKPEEREKAAQAIEKKYEEMSKSQIVGRKGINLPGFGSEPDEKDQELLTLLKKHIAVSRKAQYE